MFNILTHITKVIINTNSSDSNSSILLWLLLGIGLFIIVLIKILYSKERKVDAQFDEIHNQSADFRLINSLIQESKKY